MNGKSCTCPNTSAANVTPGIKFHVDVFSLKQNRINEVVR